MAKVASCEIELAATLVTAGQLDEAEQIVAQVLERLPEGARLRPSAWATEARIGLLRGDSGRALTLATQAEAHADELGRNQEGRAWVSLIYAKALAANGQHEQAQRAIVAARWSAPTPSAIQNGRPRF